MRLGIASMDARILTQTIARNDEASSYSSITMKTIPALASPSVRSKTHRTTRACLRDTHPQQHESAILKHERNLLGSLFRGSSDSAQSSSAITGAGLIGANSCVMSKRGYSH